MRHSIARAVTALVAAVLVTLTGRAESPVTQLSDAGATVERFLAETGPALTSYRARRHLEASTRAGRMRASLTASTEVDATGAFHYQVLEESGAGVIRSKVLHVALETERTQRRGEAVAGGITPANYEFESADLQDGLVKVSIRPRREHVMLLEGTLFLTPEADLVRVEGRPSRRPSFWVRRADVVRRYARINGVRVPISLESTAHVLFTGKSNFSMTYEYESINGQPVALPAGGALAATQPHVSEVVNHLVPRQPQPR